MLTCNKYIALVFDSYSIVSDSSQPSNWEDCLTIGFDAIKCVQICVCTFQMKKKFKFISTQFEHVFRFAWYLALGISYFWPGKLADRFTCLIQNKINARKCIELLFYDNDDSLSHTNSYWSFISTLDKYQLCIISTLQHSLLYGNEDKKNNQMLMRKTSNNIVSSTTPDNFVWKFAFGCVVLNLCCNLQIFFSPINFFSRQLFCGFIVN